MILFGLPKVQNVKEQRTANKTLWVILQGRSQT